MPLKTAAIGKTGLRVTTLGLGGAPLGGNFARVTEDSALRTVGTALDLGVRYFDTAPLYGHGKSEGLFGRGLAQAQRDTFVLSSKVGRVLNPTTANVATLCPMRWCSTSAETGCCARWRTASDGSTWTASTSR